MPLTKSYELYLLSILLPNDPELVRRFISFDGTVLKIIASLKTYVSSLQ